ncbi:MAG: hypothetical protein RLZZ15_1322 [Verrucomicrobiota bacterium]|jgi:outer membrane biosynthesis protein TonB
MNRKSLLVAAALAGAAFVSTASAFTPKETKITPEPRPIIASVVTPTDLPRSFSGAVINVEFSLDAAGRPRDIQVLWVSDAALKRQLVAAFSQWRFDAPTGDPAVTQKRFILPIELKAEA